MPLPRNFTFYIAGYGEIKYLKDKNINWILGFTHPGNQSPVDLSPLGEIEHTVIFNYHDAWAVHHPLELKWPDKALVQNIIDEANKIKKALDNGEQVNLLCQCQAGISRSTATAYIILNVLLGEWNEREALNHLLNKRFIARPNPLMVKFADKILDRKYKMMAPIKQLISVDPREENGEDILLF
jgi:predicted protein tyrosine phosphatase